MRISAFDNRVRCAALVSASVFSLLASSSSFAHPLASNDAATSTPIKHVIVIIGENRTFDHVFATYKPVNSMETVFNLLSEGIVKADGAPGANYNKARQSAGMDYDAYQLAPAKTPYTTLPPAMSGGPSVPYGCQALKLTGTSCDTPANETSIAKIEPAIDPSYVKYLLTGGNPAPHGKPDTRISYDGQGPDDAAAGPVPADLEDAALRRLRGEPGPSPLPDVATARLLRGRHRGRASEGLRPRPLPWVEVTVGAGANGAAQPVGFTNQSTGEGSTSMQFFNMQTGDAPYLKLLADTYTMSDNYHQAVNGGTGANHVMLGTGDAAYFSDGKGDALTPPNHPVDPAMPGTPLPGYASALSEIENPNPQPGTNNFYTEDGYGGGSGSPAAKAPSANYGGGSYVNCADPASPASERFWSSSRRTTFRRAAKSGITIL